MADKGADIENLLSGQDETGAAVDEAIAGGNPDDPKAIGNAVTVGTETFTLSQLSNKYELDESKPIKHLSSDFANAYPATEKKLIRGKKDGDDEIYALVFHKNFSARLRAISKVVGHNVPSFQNVLDAGVITIGKGNTEHLAIIVQKINGISLRAMLERDGPLPEKFISQIVVPSVNSAIGHLNRVDVLHGRINLDTLIYQKEFDRVVVTECFSDYCGFSQPAVYEPLERAEAMPAGKGEADDNADYFALGVVCALLLQGESIIEGRSDPEMISERLSRTSYGYYVVNTERMGNSKELLRGLLQDHSPERWGTVDVHEWQARKKTAAGNTARPLKESLTGYEFNNKPFLGRRALAQEMFQHWTAAKIEVKIEDLGRWLRLNVMRPDLSDELDLTINPAKRKEAIMADDDMTKVISIIDPDGPLRHNEFSASPYGTPQLLAHGLTRGKREYAQFVADAFNKGLISHWMELQEPLTDYDYNRQYWSAVTIGKHLRRSTLGFGLERVLYDMNPGLPCQSTLTQKHLVLSLHELLVALDAQADDVHEKQDPVDRHIAAFIASRLNLQDEIRIKSIRHFPHFAKSPQILVLALLTLAQTESKTRNLHSLTKWLIKRIGPLVATIQSKSIRKDFQTAIDQAGKAGDLHHLFNVVTSPNFVKKDAFGFSEAVKQYQMFSKEIFALKKQDSIERVAYQHGLKIAVMTSYVVCFSTLIALVMQL